MNRNFLAALLLFTVGCAARQSPPLHTPAGVAQSHFLGTSISGPQSGTLPADAAADALLVRIRMAVLRQMPGEHLASPGADARLVLATRDRQPVLATGQLTAPVRWGTAGLAQTFARALEQAPADAIARWPDATVALPAGVTARWIASDDPARRHAGEDVPAVELYITHLADRADERICELAIAVIDEVEIDTARNEAESNGTTKPATPRRQWQRELLVFRPQAIDGGAMMGLAVPFQFDRSPARCVVATFEVTPAPKPPDDTFAQAMERCAADVKRETENVEQRLQQALSTRNWPGLEAARSALADATTRRAALVYLATQTEASLARDIFLIADDPTLAVLVESFLSSLPTVSEGEQALLGVQLDLACMRHLAKQLSDNKLSPEMSAVLTSFAGEAGRHAASIDEIVKSASSRDALDTRLVAENLIYLEDSSPSSRVRAYDWLRRHNRAPEGYDPLGEAKARRAALEKALAQFPAP